MASFNPKNSSTVFNLKNLLKLAEFYPDDFSSTQLIYLVQELWIYIDNVRAYQRFANLNVMDDLAKVLMGTRKHLVFPLVYQLLKFVQILTVATTSVERCFFQQWILSRVFCAIKWVSSSWMSDWFAMWGKIYFLLLLTMMWLIYLRRWQVWERRL